MIYFIIGIVLGSAFSPFWIALYDFFKSKVKQFLDNRKK